MIPVASFCFQRGKCARCGATISYQYPLIELASGIIFVLAFLKFDFSLKLPIYLLASTIFLAIAGYDLRHKIVPNQLVYTAVALGLLSQILDFNLPDFLSGPIFFAVFASLWFLSSGKWMGFGDAKLVLAIGWLLGLHAGLSALLYGFWVGALVGIALLFIRRPYFTIKQEIPFAPFLILGFFLSSLWSWDIMSLLF